MPHKKHAEFLPAPVRSTIDRYFYEHGFVGYRALSKLISDKHGIFISKSSLWEQAQVMREEVVEEAAEGRELRRLTRRLRAVSAGLSDHPEVLVALAKELIERKQAKV